MGRVEERDGEGCMYRKEDPTKPTTVAMTDAGSAVFFGSHQFINKQRYSFFYISIPLFPDPHMVSRIHHLMIKKRRCNIELMSAHRNEQSHYVRA